MKLSTVFDSLRYGALKGQAIAREGAEIEPINYPRLITCINAAISILYGRYKLKYGEIILRLVEGKSIYEIHSDYADANTESTQPIKWIVDSVNSPFTDDLIRVHVVTLDDGTNLGINDSTDCLSISTPTYNSIQIPLEVIKTINIINSLSIIYEASPEMITPSSEVDPKISEVLLPDSMLEAASYYAAGKFMEQSSAQDKSIKAQEFFTKYEQKCSELEFYGMVNTDQSSNINIGLNEWP
jgi:hypothetical protein